VFPRMVKVRQNKEAFVLSDIKEAVQQALAAIQFKQMDLRGKKIGITAGSRGIRNLPEIIKLIVTYIEDMGGNPVLIPAMGTHGGGSLEGQKHVLASLGISEDSTGAPVHCCLDTVLLGTTPSGVPVYCNSDAAKMDGLVIVNRIKSHTDFSGEIESGICKMFAIGLGSEQGAYTTHAHAIIHGYEKVITEVAQLMIAKLPVLFALGIMENWKGDTAAIEGFLPEEIISREKLMLIRYKEALIKLPFSQLDVLVVGEIGKNISGTGMDTKVIGRIHIMGQKEPESPQISRIVVLGLTKESHGNAIGIGLADITTQKVYQSIDLRITGFNSISSMAPEQGFLPCVVANDQEAFEAALMTLGAVDFSKVKMVYIKNTSALEEFAVSEALLQEVQADKCLETIGYLEELRFNSTGDIVSFKEVIQ